MRDVLRREREGERERERERRAMRRACVAPRACARCGRGRGREGGANAGGRRRRAEAVVVTTGGRTRVVAARGGQEEDARGEEEGEKGERVDEDSLAMRVAMGLLDFYKREISPALPKSCRFVPTCSEYARQAYKKYGTKKGFVLTAWRIMRCNPLGGKGYDPPMWPPVYLGSDPVRLDDER